MTSNRLKNLAKLRLVLSVIAVLLAGLMVVSGVMHYMAMGQVSPPEEPPVPTSSSPETTAPESTVPEFTESSAETEGDIGIGREKVETPEELETAPENSPGGNLVNNLSSSNNGYVYSGKSLAEKSVKILRTGDNKSENEILAQTPSGGSRVYHGSETEENSRFPWLILFWGSAVLLAIVLVVILIKKLSNCRIVLLVVAFLLTGLMVISGVSHFGVREKISHSEAPPVPTSSISKITAPESTVPESTESSMEIEGVIGIGIEQEEIGKPSDDKQNTGTNSDDKNEDKNAGNSSNGGNTTGNGANAGNTTGSGTNAENTTGSGTNAENTTGSGANTENTTGSDANAGYTTGSDANAGNTTRTDTDDKKITDSNSEPVDPVTKNHTGTIGDSNSASQENPMDIQPIGGSKEEADSQADPGSDSITATDETQEETLDETQEETAGEPSATVADDGSAPEQEPEPQSDIWLLLSWISAGLLVVDLIAIMILSRKIRAEKKKLRRAKAKIRAASVSASQHPQTANIRQGASLSAVTVGTIHQVGARDYQQDSLGHAAVLDDKGTLAVLADGMGGLSGGEKVSQQIVMNALSLGHQLRPGQTNGVLWKMVNQINEDVNRTLGPDGLYKSGSTVVAVLVYSGHFQWIAVGDSRIYLYRQGYANQLNRDHDQLQTWMAEVLDGRRSMEETLRNPDGRKLTSFIGMGQLKHVDGSHSPIALEPGDRLVLMSDGIYNVISEEHLAAILKRYPDVNQAAAAIEHLIREAKNPHQDNYTAIILGF